ncbi:MAG: hypothetical protein WCF33_20420, partial [Pseudonocardiaceae bacterium]
TQTVIMACRPLVEITWCGWRAGGGVTVTVAYKRQQRHYHTLGDGPTGNATAFPPISALANWPMRAN